MQNNAASGSLLKCKTRLWLDWFFTRKKKKIFTKLFNSGKFHGRFKDPSSNSKQGENHPSIFNSTWRGVAQKQLLVEQSYRVNFPPSPLIPNKNANQSVAIKGTKKKKLQNCGRSGLSPPLQIWTRMEMAAGQGQVSPFPFENRKITLFFFSDPPPPPAPSLRWVWGPQFHNWLSPPSLF